MFKNLNQEKTAEPHLLLYFRSKHKPEAVVRCKTWKLALCRASQVVPFVAALNLHEVFLQQQIHGGKGPPTLCGWQGFELAHICEHTAAAVTGRNLFAQISQ